MRSEVRHRLKEDRFAETAQDTFSWMRDHSINLVGGIIVAGVIIGLTLGGYFYMENREQKASADLGQAMETLNAPIRAANPSPDPTDESYPSVKDRALAAEKKFQGVANQYPHMHSGKIAGYFVGISELQAGNNSAGEARLKQIAASGDKELAPLAKLALASFYSSTGRNPEAITLLKDLVDHPSHAVAKTTAQFQLAGVYETTQPAEARKLYEEIEKEDPKGPQGDIGRQAMMKIFGIKR